VKTARLGHLPGGASQKLSRSESCCTRFRFVAERNPRPSGARTGHPPRVSRRWRSKVYSTFPPLTHPTKLCLAGTPVTPWAIHFRPLRGLNKSTTHEAGALANCRNTVEDLCLQSTKRKILTRHNKGAQDDNSSWIGQPVRVADEVIESKIPAQRPYNSKHKK
jgi:hypothetical protein